MEILAIITIGLVIIIKVIQQDKIRQQARYTERLRLALYLRDQRLAETILSLN